MMQKYQVFIDEHFISFVDNPKRNQQSVTLIKLYNPSIEEIELLINFLYEEKDTKIALYLIANNQDEIWQTFLAHFQLIEAAGGVVKNSHEEILFIHRFGKWDLPKGKMERGEIPEESAIREVEEECGIHGMIIQAELPPTYHMYWHKEQYVLKKTHWYSMVYNGNETLIAQAEEGIEAVKWIKKDQLAPVLENTYASLYSMIEQLNKA